MNILKLMQATLILMLISNLELTERKRSGLLSSLGGDQQKLELPRERKLQMVGMTKMIKMYLPNIQRNSGLK